MAKLIIEVDAKTAIKVLNDLNKAIDDTGKKADKSFGKAGKSIQAVFDPISLIKDTTKDLINVFVELGTTAVKAIVQITEGAVELNKEAELTKISLTSIFGGNEKAADAFINQIKDLSSLLGVSRSELTGLAKGILPDIGGVQETEQFLKNIIVLGKDAGQRIDSIRIAAEEALSGNLSSLQRRLNIPKATIESIKEYNKTMSLASAINKALAERIEQTGISAENTAQSLSTLEGAIRTEGETLQQQFGVAPFEKLREQAERVLDIFERQGPEITDVAEAFGDLVANVIDFIGSGLIDYIENVDFQSVEQLVVSLNKGVAAAELVIDSLLDLPDAQQGILGATVAIDKFRGELESIAQLAQEIKIAIQSAFFSIKILSQIQTGNIVGAIKSIGDVGKAFSAESQEKSVQNINDAFADYEKRIQAINDAQRERRQITKDTTAADIAAGDAFLTRQRLEREAIDAAADAAEAQEEIDEKTAKDAAEREKRLTDIQRKESQQRFDDAVKNAQKREDIARQNVEDIEDIFRKQNQAISDAATDLSRDEEDIARKASRNSQEIEQDAADKRLDIERNYRLELQRIQDRFSQDSQEAERNNDAKAFLRAQRTRDQQLKLATQERGLSLQDATTDTQKQRDDLKTTLAEQLEDAKINNRRKLEDLQLRLNRELEAQDIKIQRDLEQQALAEQRQAEQRALANQRALEEFDRNEAEKQAKLNASLEKQFEIIAAAKEKELDLLRFVEAEKTAIAQKETERRAKIIEEAEAEAAQTSLPALPSGINRGGLTALAGGGDLAAGQTAIVGENGPELFTAPSNGMIIPNQAMFSPPSGSLSMPANINNSRNLTVGQMGINPGESILSRMVQNELSRFMEILG